MQGSSPFPVLYNYCTKAVKDLINSGITHLLAVANNVPLSKTWLDTHPAVQELLEKGP